MSTQIDLDKAVKPGGYVEFHAHGCQAASKGAATVTTESFDLQTFQDFQADVEMEARDLNLSRSEQTTRFHACLRSLR